MHFLIQFLVYFIIPFLIGWVCGALRPVFIGIIVLATALFLYIPQQKAIIDILSSVYIK